MQRQAPLRDSSISCTAFDKKDIVDTFRPNLKILTKQWKCADTLASSKFYTSMMQY